MRARRNPFGFGRPEKEKPIPAIVRNASRRYYRAADRAGMAQDQARKAHEATDEAFRRLDSLARKYGLSAKEVNIRRHRGFR